MKFLYITLAALAAAIVLLILFYIAHLSPARLGGYTVTSLILAYPNGSSFDVNAYVASSAQQQAYGLMYLPSMGSCNGAGSCYGMLFVFPNSSSQCFWMKNTMMPLRQLWILGNVIVASERGTPYSTKVYCHTGNMVLETYPNSSLAIGDRIYLGQR